MAAVKVIDSPIKVYPIDTTRLYVGGLSWGGIGTEALMMSYPNKFAAAFPCAGENWLNTVNVMTKTPFWIFHGAADGTVPVAKDRALVSAVEAAKIDIPQFVSGANMANATAISVDSLRKAVAAGSSLRRGRPCPVPAVGNQNRIWKSGLPPARRRAGPGSFRREFLNNR